MKATPQVWRCNRGKHFLMIEKEKMTKARNEANICNCKLSFKKGE